MSSIFDNLDVITELVNTGLDMQSNVNQMNLAEDKLIAANQALEIKNKQANYLKEDSRNYEIKKKYLTEEREDNETKINQLVNDMKRYGVNVEEYSKLDDKYLENDGKILGDLGVEYGENFQFREILSDDYGQQLKNTEGLIKVQRDAIDVLGREYQQILNLQDDFLKVKDDAARGLVKNAIDYNDQMIYVNQNPEKFAKDAIFKDGEFVDTDLIPREERTPITPGIAAGGNIFELNELAKAFLSEKQNIGGVQYGFRDQARVDALIGEQAKRAADVAEAKAEEELEWISGIEFNLNNITKLEDAMGGVSHELLSKPHKGKGRLSYMEGTSKLYTTKENRKKLMNVIADKIVGIMTWGDRKMGDVKKAAMTGLDDSPGGIKSKILAIKGTDNPTKFKLLNQVHDMIIPDPNKNEVLHGESLSWKDEDMANIDLKEGWQFGGQQELPEEYLAELFKAFHEIYIKDMTP